ncbi:MAG TPA: hypothetical protein VGD06_09775 [Acidobacteriota bacterium]
MRLLHRAARSRETRPMTDLDRQKLMMVATTAIALLWAITNLG